jgi:hypothetical protein
LLIRPLKVHVQNVQMSFYSGKMTTVFYSIVHSFDFFRMDSYVAALEAKLAEATGIKINQASLEIDSQ